MPITSDSSSPVGKNVPLNQQDIDRLRKTAPIRDVVQKAYELDSGFRQALNHWASLPDVNPTLRDRLPELALNRYYYGKWEPKKADDLTARISQDAKVSSNPGLFGRMKNRILQAGEDVRQSLDAYNAGKQGFVDTTLQTAGSLFSGTVSPATELSSTVVGGALRATGADKVIAKGAEKLAESPIGKAGTKFYQDLKQAAPEKVETFERVGKAALDATDVYGSAKTVEALGKGAKYVAKEASKNVKQSLQRDFDEVVAQGIAKGVKPQFRGPMRSSATALKDYNQKASEAVRQILNGTDSLQYVDDSGQIASVGHAPRNLAEFAQAIDQTKRRIFGEYTALTQQATGQGMIVDLDDIVDKLIDYADDPVKQLADKSKTEYALRLADQLMKQKSLNPTQVEGLIKELNQGLAPTYADKVAKGVSEVDVSVAQLLRSKLDDAVMDATGQEYQPLKNAYGALKAIEKDVGHQALKVARQNARNIYDLTDIFTGADLAASIVTGNPAFLVRGAVGFGIKEAYKSIISPDANIMRMFNRAQGALRGQVDDAAAAVAEARKVLFNPASTAEQTRAAKDFLHSKGIGNPDIKALITKYGSEDNIPMSELDVLEAERVRRLQQ